MTRIISVEPDLVEIDGVLYRVAADDIRQSGIRSLEIIEPRHLLLYVCAGCGAIIQPFARMYCGDACKDHYWALVRKGAIALT